MLGKIACVVAGLLLAAAFAAPPLDITCDIVIAGGSLASVAAVLTAARRAPSKRVCDRAFAAPSQ